MSVVSRGFKRTRKKKKTSVQNPVPGVVVGGVGDVFGVVGSSDEGGSRRRGKKSRRLLSGWVWGEGCANLLAGVDSPLGDGDKCEGGFFLKGSCKDAHVRVVCRS